MHTKTIIFIIYIVSLLPLKCSSYSKFSACWGFGGLLTDTGNNNFSPTTYRSNSKPYSRNFPNKLPTGRFSDGKIPIDLICSGIGLKEFTPPYLDNARTSDRELLTGATFGSAGAGYDPLTSILSRSLPIQVQLDLFKKALARIRILVGEEMTRSIVDKSLFVLAAGNIDFAYFYNFPIRSVQYNISGYQDFVLRQVRNTIQTLYDVGARRFLVSNVFPIGCTPRQITFSGRITRRRCIQRQNDDSFVYNGKLELLLSNLQQALPFSTIVPFDTHNITVEVFRNLAKYDFEVLLKGCCGSGLLEFGVTCIATGSARTCRDESKYVFWDSLNPTEKFNKILTDNALRTINSKFSI